MDFCYFIGIDIAKDTLDWAVYTQQGLQLSTHSPNTQAGVKTALAEFKALPDWSSKQAVFCMEHTGIYNAHLLELLYELKLAVWLESSLQIKQAGGMQWGKTDEVDAQRIAQYAYRFGDQIRLWEPPREVIQKIAFLSATRQRLNQAYNLLAVPVAEQETFISKSLQKTRTGGPAQRQRSKITHSPQRRTKSGRASHQKTYRGRRSAERIVRSDGLRARHWACDRH